MKKIGIMTDSNAGFTMEEAKNLNIHILPMPIIVNQKTYYEGINLNLDTFYKLQESGADITTSQPSPGQLLEMWETLLKDYDEIVYIPMTSGLSGSCQSAMVLSDEFEGKVQVVDNRRISATQAQSVLDALVLKNEEKDASEIKEILENEAMDATIYISVNTLKYLTKSGRVTPAAAMLGNALHVVPVMTIQGGKLDAYSKARGMKAAYKKMLKALKNDLETRLKPLYDKNELVIAMAYTNFDENEIASWKSILQEEFPNDEIINYPLMCCIGAHTGPGAFGIGAVRRHK